MKLKNKIEKTNKFFWSISSITAKINVISKLLFVLGATHKKKGSRFHECGLRSTGFGKFGHAADT